MYRATASEARKLEAEIKCLSGRKCQDSVPAVVLLTVLAFRKGNARNVLARPRGL